ncbi:hypothetical protein [Lysinibacillus fusiformis]|uniref:hypothetical protein n=1 Tax=Lysinibacillus fusiformis TaxID=28031 RepID=UPI003D03B012
MNRAGVVCRRELNPLEAIIYLPAGLAASGTWRDACAEFCQRKRYHITAVVTEWADAVGMIVGGEADVLVVGSRDHLPRERRPRIDVVVEEKLDLPPSQRRPRRM